MFRWRSLFNLALVSSILLLLILPAISLAQSCPASTIADPAGIPEGTYPQQYELAEYQTLANCSLIFSSNPYFQESNEWYSYETLPPIEERLPSEPLVVQPYEQIGNYGGELLGVSDSAQAGTVEVLSFRHVNLLQLDDDNFTLVPNIAKSWTFNEDFTELTFFLREGHKWSDGMPFTSEDIVFWYNDLVLNPELFTSVPPQWVINGEPMQVEAIDETTVRFSFAAPAPNFLRIFTYTNSQPFQPKHILSQFHIKYNPDADELATSLGYESWEQLFQQYYAVTDWKDEYHPLSGPQPVIIPTLESHFLVSETEDGRILIANPYFHVVDTTGQQLPYINEIHETYYEQSFDLLYSWAADGLISYKSQGWSIDDFYLLDNYRDEGNYSIQVASRGNQDLWSIFFNVTAQDPEKAKIFGDVRFRQAMSVAISRDEINRLFYSGLGTPMQAMPADSTTVSFVPESAQNAFIQYDPEQANHLLDEMGLTERDSEGFRLQFDGEPLIIDLIYVPEGALLDLPVLLKDYWEAVGVRVNLGQLTTAEYRVKARNNELDMVMGINDQTTGTVIATDPGRLYPPFDIQFVAPRTGIPWDRWMRSGGTEGIEPPDDVKRLYELAAEFKLVPLGSDESNRIGAEIIQIHVDNLFAIGLVGDIPKPILVSSRLDNVPEITNLAVFYGAYPFRPYQWYFQE